MRQPTTTHGSLGAVDAAALGVAGGSDVAHLALDSTYPPLVEHAGRFRGPSWSVLGLALLATGCGEPRHAARPASRRVPTRRRRSPPIDRLGRWNGTTFVPVTPGSIRGGDLYVLVHGWAPGYLAAVRRAHRTGAAPGLVPAGG